MILLPFVPGFLMGFVTTFPEGGFVQVGDKEKRRFRIHTRKGVILCSYILVSVLVCMSTIIYAAMRI